MSFQNRLSYFQDKRNARLLRNAAALSGVHTDVILVDIFRNATYDVKQIRIRELIFVPVVFPHEAFENVQARLIQLPDNSSFTLLAIPIDTSLSLYVSTEHPINKDDLLFWMIEDFSYPEKEIYGEVLPATPALLLLRVKELTAHFGTYGITHKKLTCSTEDPSSLPGAAREALLKVHEKRRQSFLTSHARVQKETIGG